MTSTASPLATSSATPIPTSRVAFAAAHVVADPLADNAPGSPAVLDWDSTLAFRRHLYAHGLGLAEAMDTAQRGMGLDWATTQELIRRSAPEAAEAGARICAGAGTDQLAAAPGAATLADTVGAYEEQLAFVESCGVQPILMASRHLAAAAQGPEDYLRTYDTLLSQASRPVILHWLGPAFDPALQGYWGSDDVATATATALTIIADHASAVDGIKISLLDADHERSVRSRLPDGVRLYTGDDFHYPELVRGDGTHHSDALLGVFAAIAPAAARALAALDAGDDAAYDAAFAPTLPLARHLFSAPTFHYKTGIAFLAWLNGFQPGFTMVGGLQSARGLPHLAETFRLADAAGVLTDPDVAVERMSRLLAMAGVTR